MRVLEEKAAGASIDAGACARAARVEATGSSAQKGGGGGGVVGRIKEAAGEVVEEVLEAVEPGREQAGEVFQEEERGAGGGGGGVRRVA